MAGEQPVDVEQFDLVAVDQRDAGDLARLLGRADERRRERDDVDHLGEAIGDLALAVGERGAA